MLNDENNNNNNNNGNTTNTQDLIEELKHEQSGEPKPDPEPKPIEHPEAQAVLTGVHAPSRSERRQNRGLRLSLDTKIMRQLIFLLALGMAFYWLAQNVQIVPSLVFRLLNLMAPIVIGVFLAIIINIPTRSIERRLFSKPWGKNDRIRQVIKRPISMLLALIIIFGLVAIFVVLFIPEIERTISVVSKQLPKFLNEGGATLETYIGEHPDLEAFLNSISFDYKDTVERIVSWFASWSQEFMRSTLSIAVNIMNSFLTFFLALIFALYAIGQKEKLGLSARKIAYAYLKEKRADRLINIVSLSGEIFSDYFTAQGIEAMILGSLVFIAMTIFSFPYALIISVLVAIFALIPIFGAYIAGGLGFILILFSASLGRALGFVLLFIIVQQFEGNVIYPRVVGKRLGLPPIWVFVAVTLGGKFFGFAGFLLAVPVTSIVYTLIKINSEIRIEEREIDQEKIQESPLKRINAEKDMEVQSAPMGSLFLKRGYEAIRRKASEIKSKNAKR